MKVTPELLQHLEALARIHLDDGERARMQRDLEQILEHFEALRALNLDDEEEMVRPIALVNRLRDDAPEAELETERALSVATERDDGFFKVPRSIE